MSNCPSQDVLKSNPAAETPTVTVIVPVYNAGATLRTAVGSILRQSLTSLEVIIVDDGSTDDSLAVAREMARCDCRIRVFSHPCNRGQSAARNLALRKARGRWIALVDADDEIAEQRLETLSEAGELEGADLIADGVEFVGPRQPGTPARLLTCETAGGRLPALTPAALIESDIPLNGLCSFGYLKPLMRREFLERWQLRYDESLRFSEDLNLYLRALICGGRFLLHPRSLYVYNQTPVSASRNVQVLPTVADHALVNNHRMRELVAECRIVGVQDLLEEHGQRWATVLWFNRLKLALRRRRITEFLFLTLECPSGPRGVIRFARDRARIKAASVCSDTRQSEARSPAARAKAPGIH